MCKSQAEGGQRCASHAREQLRRAQDAFLASQSPEDYKRLMDAQVVWASTPQGNRQTVRQADEAFEDGRLRDARALRDIARRGDDLAERNRQMAAIARGDGTDSKGRRVKPARERSDRKIAREMQAALNWLGQRDLAAERQAEDERDERIRHLSIEAYGTPVTDPVLQQEHAEWLARRDHEAAAKLEEVTATLQARLQTWSGDEQHARANAERLVRDLIALTANNNPQGREAIRAAAKVARAFNACASGGIDHAAVEAETFFKNVTGLSMSVIPAIEPGGSPRVRVRKAISH